MRHNSGHAFIRAYFQCHPNTDYQPVLFMVDTGCSTTTLSPDDVARLSINCTLLRATTANVGTANGIIHPYIFPNPELRLKINYGWFNHKTTFSKLPLDFIYCIPPPPRGLTYSTIGQDILRYFRKWIFTDTELILQS